MDQDQAHPPTPSDSSCPPSSSLLMHIEYADMLNFTRLYVEQDNVC